MVHQLRKLILQLAYSFRTYGLLLDSNIRFAKTFSDYRDELWSEIRANAFGDSKIALPSSIDYERICELISNIEDIGNRKLKILDFGGGNLNLYHQVSDDFPNLRFDWTIVENSRYFAAIKQYWGEKQNSFRVVSDGFQVGAYPNLFITDHLPTRNFDICIAGAVLGWVDSPLHTLHNLMRITDNLLITRTLMAKKTSKLGYQRTFIGGEIARVKCWFLDEDELTSTPNFIKTDIWLSGSDPIYSIYGKWQFKSLLLKRIK